MAINGFGVAARLNRQQARPPLGPAAAPQASVAPTAPPQAAVVPPASQEDLESQITQKLYHLAGTALHLKMKHGDQANDRLGQIADVAEKLDPDFKLDEFLAIAVTDPQAPELAKFVMNLRPEQVKAANAAIQSEYGQTGSLGVTAASILMDDTFRNRIDAMLPGEDQGNPVRLAQASTGTQTDAAPEPSDEEAQNAPPEPGATYGLIPWAMEEGSKVTGQVGINAPEDLVRRRTQARLLREDIMFMLATKGNVAVQEQKRLLNLVPSMGPFENDKDAASSLMELRRALIERKEIDANLLASGNFRGSNADVRRAARSQYQTERIIQRIDEMISWSEPGGQEAGGEEIAEPKTREERDALEPGTRYRAPDGTVRIR